MLESFFEKVADGESEEQGVEKDDRENISFGEPEDGSKEIKIVGAGVEAAKGEFGADEGEPALGDTEDFKHVAGKVGVVGVGVVEVVGVEGKSEQNDEKSEDELSVFHWVDGNRQVEGSEDTNSG